MQSITPTVYRTYGLAEGARKRKQRQFPNFYVSIVPVNARGQVISPKDREQIKGYKIKVHCRSIYEDLHGSLPS